MFPHNSPVCSLNNHVPYFQVENVYEKLSESCDRAFFLFKDPVKAIKKIADFIDCGATDDDVNRVATNTAFEAMKAAKMKDHPEFAKVIMNKGTVWV